VLKTVWKSVYYMEGVLCINVIHVMGLTGGLYVENSKSYPTV